jgi:hypothetical protein
MPKKKFRNCPCTPCGLIISGDIPMCAPHWELVPAAERDAICEAQRTGSFRASREALVKAIIYVNAALKQPSTINHQLPKALLLFLLLALGIGQGCMVARYSRTPASPCPCSVGQDPVGRGSCRALASTNQTESVRFSVWSCLMNEKAVKISVDKFTGKTHSGITIGSVEGAVDDDALKAIVSAAVETTIKAFLGL